MTKIKNWIRKFLASPKTRAVALMLLVGSTAGQHRRVRAERCR